MVSIEAKCEFNQEGTIACTSPCVTQPDQITNVKLHMYQLQTIFHMLQLESDPVTLPPNECTFHGQYVSEIGILSNKVGSGKSLCVLGLIAHRTEIPPKPRVHTFYEHVGAVHASNTSASYLRNLIVVPNHILKPVWETYLMSFTTFSFISIKKAMFPISWDDLTTYDIVLCNATHYNMFMKSCPYSWSRVVFDEADSIQIPACAPPKAHFVWFVTSSLNNLLFCNGYYWKIDNTTITRMVTTGILRNGYIKNTFKSLENVKHRSIFKGIIVKMNDAYIDSFVPLLPIQRNVIICQTPVYLKVLQDVLPEHMMDLLHGNDLESALQSAGFPVDSKENLVSYISRSLHVKKANLEKKITYLQHLEYENEPEELNKHNQRRHICSEIDKIDIQLQRIHQVIHNIDLDDVSQSCPVCLEHQTDTQSLVVLTCCLNVFCDQCIRTIFMQQSNMQKCPLCRNPFSRKTIVKTASNVPMYKSNILKNLLQQSQKKMVVFFKREASIVSLLPELTVPYKMLNGNNQTILKTIEWFQQDEHNVLFVNVELYACGLNLLHATDIIFYQKMSRELETQLIGRAYRIGRDPHQVLTVHHLLHQDE